MWKQKVRENKGGGCGLCVNRTDAVVRRPLRNVKDGSSKGRDQADNGLGLLRGEDEESERQRDLISVFRQPDLTERGFRTARDGSRPLAGRDSR